MRALPAVPGLPARVRGPDRPALPRRAQRLPGVRAAGDAARRARRCGRRRARWTRAQLAAGAAQADAAATRRSRAAAELLRARRDRGRSRVSAAFTWPATPPTSAAVRRLKERKRRPHKPLAVMFADLEQVARALPPRRPPRRTLLASSSIPIVLVEWREIGAGFAPGPELGAGARTGEPPPAGRAGGDRRRAPAPDQPRGRGAPALPRRDAAVHAAAHPAAARRPAGRW